MPAYLIKGKPVEIVLSRPGNMLLNELRIYIGT
jgi:hypothetical protein